MKVFELRAFIIILLIGFGLNVSEAQVTAAFTANTTTNCGSFVVQFTNQSTGSGTLSYTWDLGNGNFSTQTNPSALYTTPGKYSVTLTVTNGVNADQELKQDYITVFAPPQPSFTANPLLGCPPVNVTFTNTSVEGSAPVQSIVWDFGDGSIGNSGAGTIAHSYTSPGNYGVTMVVTDANGCQANQTFPNTISANNSSPVAAFTATDTALCSQPFTTHFTNQSTTSGAVTYLWDFGDGTTSVQTSPNHTFAAAGNYDVTLTATYPSGCSNTLTKLNYITAISQTVPDFSADAVSVCAGVTINFQNTSAPLPEKVLWTFGDGTTDTLINTSHIYSAPGTYTVKLVNIYGQNCRDSITKVNYIFVSPSPVANFTGTPTHSCSPPLTVNFTNTSTGAAPLSYQWNFFNGASNLTNPSRTYNTAGAFDVRLIVTNGIGCRDTLRRIDYIVNSSPVANFGISAYYPCIPVQVNFSDSSTGPLPITNWNWNFGDGATSTQQNPTHNYAVAGSYTVTLTVTDASGCTNTFTYPTQVVVATQPTANFNTALLTVCAGASIHFNNTSTNSNLWQWLVEGQSSSNLQNPNITFEDTGRMDIMLISSNNGCLDTLTRNNYVTVNGPVNNWVFTKDCANPFTVLFNDTSILGQTYTWNFGDNSTSTLPDPSHTYAATGIYTVIHTVSNATTGCTDADTLSISITNQTATFSATTPTSGCAPLSVHFQITGTGITGRSWRFGDGTTSTSTNPTHIYSTPGVYDVTLILRFGNCRDTLVMPQYITVGGPQISFTTDTTFFCDSVITTFTNTTTSASPVATWAWDFGDGSTSTAQSPTHIYTTSGTFPVTLTATDNVGCSATVIDTDAVHILPLINPSFSANDTMPCPGQAVIFTRNFSAGGFTILWDFGDGATSNSSPSNVPHTYLAAGTYDVSITMSNASGCSATKLVTDFIEIILPTVNFSASPNVTDCPPILTNFTDLSNSNIVAWQWNFSDGGTSALQNPGHLFTTSGYFPISLSVTDNNGCTDSLTIDSVVSVNGPFGTISYTPDTTGCPPFDVTFTANTFNSSTYSWDFGDGFTGNTSSISHTYVNNGSFLPKLLIQNATGCSLTLIGTDSVIVTPFPVSAGIDALFCAGQNIQLLASGGTNFVWTPALGLSDDSISNPIANPDTTTTYIVMVSKGLCSNSDTIVISVLPTPIPEFTVAPVCQGNFSDFVNLTTNDTLNTTYNWSFSNGTFSTDTNPSVLYALDNGYRVGLIATSENGCIDTVYHTAFVYPNPQLVPTVSNNCEGIATQFTNGGSINSGIITSINWNFGDSTTSTLPDPLHLYFATDTFNVIVSAISDQGCSDTDSVQVIIRPVPVANFSFTDVCQNAPSLFVDSSIVSSGTISSWLWNFGNTEVDTAQNPDYTYPDSGSFNVSLLVTSEYGCSDSITQPYTVHALPQARFTTSVDSSCVTPASVQFPNQSTGSSQFQWTYGDGQTGTTQTGSNTYNQVGNYVVNLVATSSFGCRDSISDTFNVYPTPKADFNVPDVEGCQTFVANFQTTSINAIAFSWGLGDNAFSSNPSPIYAYETAGTYSVWLKVTGQGGCTDSIFKANIINVLEKPTALFTYTVKTTPQIDGTVLFQNTSINQTNSIWVLGDGSLSTSNDTFSHHFDTWGNQEITLYVSSANGCKDTLTLPIKVEFYGDLFVPTALVVDGEGEFGVFLPKGKGLRNYHLTIWDKWGNLLFESTKLLYGSPAESWDGTYQGQPVQLGAYIWRIEAEFQNNEFWPGKKYEDNNYKDAGTVMVIR